MKIFTHPDNVKLIERTIERDAPAILGYRPLSCMGIEIHADPMLDKERPSGRIRFRGKVFEREKFHFSTRFIDYGPEDLSFFIFIGEAVEEMEAHFLIMEDPPMFRAFLDVGFKTPPPRAIITHTSF